MQLLLRKISSADGDVQEYVDNEIEREEVLVGSSPHCDIQLLDSGIAAVHARIRQQAGDTWLVAERGRQFVHNGEAKKEAKLEQGDEIRIGSQVFTCAAPVPGFHLVLEWQYVEMPGHLLANAYRTSLADINFSPRKLSWGLALATLIIFGLMPLAGHFWGAPEPESSSPSSLWLSGPLLPAHQVILGENCNACHQSAFVQVEDRACEQCHADVGDHLADHHPGLDDLGKLADFDRFSCQNCHKEHNEPQSIVTSGDSLCRNCHEQLAPPIEGFSTKAHPEFALSVLEPRVRQLNGVLEVDWSRNKVLPRDEPREANHLKYPHDVHLDPESVRHPQRDDALQCVDCHTLSSDREHFEPISMEQHCSSCHDLSFDERNPRKQLPHGSPKAVFESLEAHFVKLAFGDQQASAFERRRRPGHEEIKSSCERDYECARQKALREADRQFSQRGCVTCHEVDQLAGAEGVERWQVLPVKLNSDWYRDARFDHQSHLTQAEQTGDELCLSCHAADTSTASSDILMPRRDQCTDCHGDKSFGDRVAVNCIACHGYHQEEEKQSPSHPAFHLTANGRIDEHMEGVAHGEL